MNQGARKFKELGYEMSLQLTQNVKFFEFRQDDPNHSLIDTPLLTGKQFGIETFNQRPIFSPTLEEIEKTNSMISDQPTIAIEAIYKSAQSWADGRAFQSIRDRFPNHRILWLSNEGAPKDKNVDDLLRFTRREAIMCLRACDIFFSVGSGFFCSSLALPSYSQPKKTVCLWTDDLYRYEKPLAKHQWHPDITWVHNHDELNQCLKSLQS
jgi:hypothetical protein